MLLTINFIRTNPYSQNMNITKNCTDSIKKNDTGDTIAFKSLKCPDFLGNCKVKKALIEELCLDEIIAEEIKPIMIFKKITDCHKEPVKAFLLKIGGSYDDAYSYLWGNKASALAVLSTEGDILGLIKNLNSSEYLQSKTPNVGKYLRLHDLYSLDDNYSGTGTALIEAAKEESKRLGLDGQLKVNARNVYSENRGCPVPFYLLKGFTFIDKPFKTREALLLDKYSIEQDYTMFFLNSKNLEKVKNAYQQANPTLY